jgi:AcrR family transcriptional regulator
MIDQSTLSGRIVAAALRLAAERAWSAVSLRDIAEAAGVTLADLGQHFSGKSGILIAFNKAIDDEVLRNAPKASPDQAPRDMVFEVVMARFDALAPYRSAIRSIVRERGGDGRLAASLLKSQYWMLQAAGVDTDGAKGAARVAGLASVYAGVFRIWLDDDDPGLARTMAALDRRLRSGERTLSSVEGVCDGARRMVSAACQTGDRLRSMLRARRGDESATGHETTDDVPPSGAPAAGSA